MRNGMIFCNETHQLPTSFDGPPAQVMNLVDKKTQKTLLEAKDHTEIWKILTGPAVDWQCRSLCLRHPANGSGCKIAMQNDLDS